MTLLSPFFRRACSAQRRPDSRSQGIRLLMASVSILGIAALGIPAYSIADELLDAVAASVNGEPITLSEIESELSPPRELSLKQAKSDKAAQAVLDKLINERIIELEAEERRISIGKEQVDAYVSQVAERNGLTINDFAEALRSQGQEIDDFRKSVRLEMLRTRLLSQVQELGSGVSEQEIDDYIENHPDLLSGDNSITLRQILVATETRSRDSAKDLVKDLYGQLGAGEAFESLARKYSDGPESREGGALGALAFDELSPEIQTALRDLPTGSFSAPVETPLGFHIFRIESRFNKSEGKNNPDLRNEVRALLKEQKLQTSLSAFFNDELLSKYAIERKI